MENKAKRGRNTDKRALLAKANVLGVCRCRQRRLRTTRESLSCVDGKAKVTRFSMREQGRNENEAYRIELQ